MSKKIIISAVVILLLLLGGGVMLFKQFAPTATVDETTEDTLTVVNDSVPEDIDPYSLNVQKRVITANVFDGLTRIDRFYRPEGALALSFGQLSSREWVFKLRKGVMFHNGEEMTSEDVLASFGKARALNNPELTELLSTISEIEAKDDYTIRLVTAAPDPLLLSKLSFIPITKDGMGAEKYIGTGAYKVSHQENGFIEFTRNEDYWDTLPTFKMVELRALPDKYDRFNEFYDGHIDVLAAVPTAEENIALLRKKEDLEILAIPGLELIYLMFNTERTVNGKSNIFYDKNIRNAISLAVNQRDIVNFAGGFATKVNQYISSGIFGFHPDLPEYEYDLEEAQVLLGGKDELEFELFVTKDFRIIAEYLKIQLQQLGVDMKFTVVDTHEQFLQNLKSESMQAYILGWRFDLGDSLGFLKTHVHSKRNEYGIYNAIGYTNRKVDTLIENAERELDDKKRLALLQEVQENLINDIIGVPLFEVQKVFGKKKSLKWEPRLDGQVIFREITHAS